MTTKRKDFKMFPNTGNEKIDRFAENRKREKKKKYEVIENNSKKRKCRKNWTKKFVGAGSREE